EALEQRRQNEQERLQRLDLIEYQLQELAEANLGDPQELTELEQERERLSHVVELQQLSYQVYQALYQNDAQQPAAADLLGQAEGTLREMVEYDKNLAAALEMVGNALREIVEAGQRINSYGDSLEVDPERLVIVEERINLLKRLGRKYGPSLAAVIAHYEKLQQELEELTGGGQSWEDLENKYQQCQESLTKACQKLTKLRKKTAKQLEKKLIEELKPLAMEKVKFECRLTSCLPSATGAEKVNFYFSPNPGEEPQPLSAIASGGEMSRFLLALKACLVNSEEKTGGTLIFDEIDTGVSGRVAQAIAQKLHQLGQHYQVLCVTHQPLIAAMADVHFRVDKEVIGNLPLLDYPQHSNGKSESVSVSSKLGEIRTVVRVTNLRHHSHRRDELAQLTGGQSADEALAFAESLLAKAVSQRQGSSK
ncbi:MAG: DNA repair protein RecN, partial [Okeania sp. SIO2D1]|nr:DNA repair protein RecN [Okeania sp. SIO2D1]